MRPIIPITPKLEKDSPPQRFGAEILWQVVLPFRVFHRILRLEMVLFCQSEEQSPLSTWQQSLTNVGLFMILAAMVVLMLSGAFFFFYLGKKAMGIDLFSSVHLL